ncbi:hypothetical protein [Fibrella aestuarina]|uniref:hypothetical protein n=1 Tax=Fibrella aestuarina TaxID=651143 RepID=UPI00059CA3D4|nr:hypothetical protein [Fibrella aestuarina]
MKLTKSLFSLALISLAVAACKSTDPDPRTQYVGTYKMAFTDVLQNRSSGATANYLSTGTLNVKLGATQAELILTERSTYPVQVSGNTFTIPAFIDIQSIAGSSVAFTVSGTGSFSPNGITVTYTGMSTVNNQAIQFSTTGTGTK